MNALLQAPIWLYLVIIFPLENTGSVFSFFQFFPVFPVSSSFFRFFPLFSSGNPGFFICVILIQSNLSKMTTKGKGQKWYLGFGKSSLLTRGKFFTSAECDKRSGQKWQFALPQASDALLIPYKTNHHCLSFDCYEWPCQSFIFWCGRIYSRVYFTGGCK